MDITKMNLIGIPKNKQLLMLMKNELDNGGTGYVGFSHIKDGWQAIDLGITTNTDSLRKMLKSLEAKGYIYFYELANRWVMTPAGYDEAKNWEAIAENATACCSGDDADDEGYDNDNISSNVDWNAIANHFANSAATWAGIAVQNATNADNSKKIEELEATIAALRAKNTDLANRLDAMTKKCEVYENNIKSAADACAKMESWFTSMTA